jgi:hypothetical protein
VYHGRSFLQLALLRRAGEQAVAIDCFAHQEHNQDSSGVGHRATFDANLARFGCDDESIRVIDADSTVLTPRAVLGGDENSDDRFRLFSVDGSHTESAVLSDLRLAEACLCDGGMVLLDDACNADWPGVVSGLVQYQAQADPSLDARLQPFALGYNKAFLTQARWHEAYSRALRPRARKVSAFLGFDCVVLPQGWIATHFANDDLQTTRHVIK